MPLYLTATAVKLFFQYRCDRQVRYSLLPDGDRAGLSIRVQPESTAPWARVGNDFESAVVAELARRESLLQPPPGKRLTALQTAAFLRREIPEVIAHQPRIQLPDTDGFRARFGMPRSVELSAAFPDLVQVTSIGDRISFRVQDVKAVHAPTVFHKAQLAFYSLLLEELLRLSGLPYVVDPVGEILHFPEPGATELWGTTEVRLSGYREQVVDFLGRILPRIVSARLEQGRDETRFHLTYKCEQCDFLPHCGESVTIPVPPAEWDLSAVPGMSAIGKDTLIRLGVRNVGDLTAAPDALYRPEIGWSLRTGANLAFRRANALLANVTSRLPDRFTCLMPPRVDAGLFLAFDTDPIEGRLAALGCLFEQDGERQITTATVANSGEDAERAAIEEVLAAVVEHLDGVDAHNRHHGATDPWIAHLFVYEPSEARDLQAALGRHLHDAAVRTGLLNLIRMFPPEPLQPDPEYRGHRHLPATALRSVFDSLYAIPVRVTHDLARVSRALETTAHPPLASAYSPAEPFARPFSSRLNIDCCRALKSGKLSASAVETDLAARLTTLANLTGWVLADNARAAIPFLQLKKDPFRWQTTFNPLASSDLEWLRAQELLATRVAELAAITFLAAPVQIRKERFRCVAPMRLVGEPQKCPRAWAAVRLRFTAPAECAATELGEGAFGVLLSDGSPELLLDPARWPDLGVTVEEVIATAEGVEVKVDVGWKAWNLGTLKGLIARRPVVDWHLDQGYADANTPKLLRFLTYLDQEPTRL